MKGSGVRFLLDANLSPKTARYLSRRFDLDVFALQGNNLGQLPDPAVIEMARREGRVIITLDRDYSIYFNSTIRPDIAIIYLDLSNEHRSLSGVNAILDRFFQTQAPTIKFENALVTITETIVTISYRA